MRFSRGPNRGSSTKRNRFLSRINQSRRLDRPLTLAFGLFARFCAIAISTRDIAGTRFRWTKEISYFGFTNAVGGLRGRLSQFNNTLRDKSGPGHGGAQRFRRKYRDGNALAKKLYVAVCPFKCDVSTNRPVDLRVMGDVVRAEYLAFAQYAALYRRLPKFNDKEK